MSCLITTLFLWGACGQDVPLDPVDNEPLDPLFGQQRGAADAPAPAAAVAAHVVEEFPRLDGVTDHGRAATPSPDHPA